MPAKKQWSDTAQESIRKLYGWIPVRDLAEKLNCTEAQLLREAAQLHLPPLRQRDDVLSINRLAALMGLSWFEARRLAEQGELLVTMYDKNRPVQVVIQTELLAWLRRPDNHAFFDVGRIKDKSLRAAALKVDDEWLELHDAAARAGYSYLGFKKLFYRLLKLGLIEPVKHAGGKQGQTWRIRVSEVDRMIRLAQDQDLPDFVLNGERYYATGKAGRLLNLTAQAVYKRVVFGQLAAVRRGNRWFVSETTIEAIRQPSINVAQVAVPRSKRMEYWNHFIAIWSLDKRSVTRRISVVQIRQKRALILGNNQLWQDVIWANGGMNLSPEMLQVKNGGAYEKAWQCFWDAVYEAANG